MDPLHPHRGLGDHRRKDGAQDPHGHQAQGPCAGDDAAGDVPGSVSVGGRGRYPLSRCLRDAGLVLPVPGIVQQPLHVDGKQLCTGQQLGRVRQGRPLLPAAHRLAGDPQPFRQGLLTQPLPLPQAGQLLSKGHSPSSSSLSHWHHHIRRRRESPPRRPDTAATKRNISSKINFSALFAAIPPPAGYFW